jgi:hypothetical protein
LEQSGNAKTIASKHIQDIKKRIPARFFLQSQMGIFQKKENRKHNMTTVANGLPQRRSSDQDAWGLRLIHDTTLDGYESALHSQSAGQQ